MNTKMFIGKVQSGKVTRMGTVMGHVVDLLIISRL